MLSRTLIYSQISQEVHIDINNEKIWVVILIQGAGMIYFATRLFMKVIQDYPEYIAMTCYYYVLYSEISFVRVFSKWRAKKELERQVSTFKKVLLVISVWSSF